MDLTTTYLGLELASPIVPGASPLVDDLDTVRRLEDAGASAIVMHSLFEEQIEREELHSFYNLRASWEAHAEALSYLPAPAEFALGPDEYLEQIRRIKRAVKVPVIASLNGTTPAGWLRYAKLFEEAGADAIELNVYHLATDHRESPAAIEGRILEVVGTVKKSVGIPVAVKLSPFFTSIPDLVRRLDERGADGLVLFNRFYQPDIDPEALEVVSTLHLSDPSELRLRLRWLAVLSGRVNASLAVTGGVHGALDVVKSLMAGAHCVQMVSALLKHGPDHLRVVREALAGWMAEHEYESVRQLQGSMSLERCPNPQAYERANYVRMLQSWRPDR